MKMIAKRMEETRESRPEQRPKDVMESTGPGIFTDAVMLHLKEVYGVQMSVKDADIFGKGKVQLGMGGVVRRGYHTPDVQILPQIAFADGSGGEVHEGVAYVRHVFRGSWKAGFKEGASYREGDPDGAEDGGAWGGSHMGMRGWGGDKSEYKGRSYRNEAYVSDLEGSCNYTRVTGVILRGHPGGIENHFEELAMAERYCERFGKGCGGVTYQGGHYEVVRNLVTTNTTDISDVEPLDLILSLCPHDLIGEAGDDPRKRK